MSKPRRRSNNKHNETYVYMPLGNGTIDKMPKSRKAFKKTMREEKTGQTQDFAIIKEALAGVEDSQVKYVPLKKKGRRDFNYKSSAGYYSKLNGQIKKVDPTFIQEWRARFAEARSKFKLVVK